MHCNRDTHTFDIDWARYGPLGPLPGVPTSDGITTVIGQRMREVEAALA